MELLFGARKLIEEAAMNSRGSKKTREHAPFPRVFPCVAILSLGLFSSPALANEDREPALSTSAESANSTVAPQPTAAALRSDATSEVVLASHRRPVHRHRVYRHWDWGWGWGYWGYWHPSPWYWGGRAYRGYPRVRSSRFAILDTDVSPEEAEVWLDGKYIGTADDFDGYPDFLYLRPGSYKLEFRLAGFESLRLDLDVSRGEHLQFDQKLARLPGRGRLDSFPPRREMPGGRAFGPNAKPEQPAVEEDEDEDAIQDRDRDRTRGDRARDRDRDRDWDRERSDRDATDKPKAVEGSDTGRAPSAQPPATSEARERAAGRARLKFKVTPDDAAIYVDDRYIGTGEDVNGVARGIPTEPGKHTITVVRPGYKSKTIEAESSAGAAIDVVVELEK